MKNRSSDGHLNKRAAELLLFTVVALRATSLLFCTICLESMGPITLNGIRFTIAFILLALLFRNKLAGVDKETLIHGSIIGIFFYLTMMTEMIGLDMTDTSTVAFLENTSIVFVPLFEAILIRKLPRVSAIISAVMGLIGVGFMTLKNGHISFSSGELVCMSTALFYTATIISTAHFSKKDDAMKLGIIQVGVIGILGIISAFMFESPTVPTDGRTWGSLMFLVIICTGLGFTLQPVAQRDVSTETAGLFCAFNPLITAILGYTFLHEIFTANKLIGAALIIGSIIISALLDRLSSRSERQELTP